MPEKKKAYLGDLVEQIEQKRLKEEESKIEKLQDEIGEREAMREGLYQELQDEQRDRELKRNHFIE
jgi:hypothetical protein